MQQVELAAKPYAVTEHRARLYRNLRTGQERAAPLPKSAANRAQNMAKRFREHGDAYFRFLDTPGIEPTNNGPERQIRFLAVDRKITQGTRGETGRRWCERIWTILATCAQQGRSAFEFIHDSILAFFTVHPSPSLLPQPP